MRKNLSEVGDGGRPTQTQITPIAAGRQKENTSVRFTPKRGARRKGFTLIELLIVILVLAILMAVALPLYLGAVADSQKKTCRANMQTIANAEQAYRTASSGHTYTTDLTALNTNLGATPKCPNSGAYTVTLNTDGTITVNCSYKDPGGDTTKDHGTFTPGKDSQ